jgi:hypothetical protein
MDSTTLLLVIGMIACMIGYCVSAWRYIAPKEMK